MKTTQEAIGQKRPFRSKHHEAVVALFVTTDRVRTAFGRMLEPSDLTPQQFNVLRILRGARPDGLPTLTIASRMIERTPGITRMIDRLETKGLVSRSRRADDRRCVHCSITAKGLDLLKRLDRAVDRFDEQALGDLTERQVAQLTTLLDRVRAANE